MKRYAIPFWERMNEAQKQGSKVKKLPGGMSKKKLKKRKRKANKPA